MINPKVSKHTVGDVCPLMGVGASHEVHGVVQPGSYQKVGVDGDEVTVHPRNHWLGKHVPHLLGGTRII